MTGPDSGMCCGCCCGPDANKVCGRLCAACFWRFCSASRRSAGVPWRSPACQQHQAPSATTQQRIGIDRLWKCRHWLQLGPGGHDLPRVACNTCNRHISRTPPYTQRCMVLAPPACWHALQSAQETAGALRPPRKQHLPSCRQRCTACAAPCPLLGPTPSALRLYVYMSMKKRENRQFEGTGQVHITPGSPHPWCPSCRRRTR
jgi:hypothetical protein